MPGLRGVNVITTPAPVVTAAGISAPSFSEIYAFLIAEFRGIYGDDIYIAPDSQDGQWIGVLAKAQHDTNTAIVAAYNARNPVGAVGAGLSSVVKLCGMTRKTPTPSTVGLVLVGRAGAVITNGLAEDVAGNRWALPASVTLGASGATEVTATAVVPGATSAPANTITKIATPQAGWQSVSNPSPTATVGAPVESDAALRRRQRASVSPSASVALTRVAGNVAQISGVTRSTALENDTGATDANGLPPHSIAVVVEGGSPQAIATAIANAKTEGGTPYGTTTQSVQDAFGVWRFISFFIATPRRVTVALTVKAVGGYSESVAAKIRAALSGYIQTLPAGGALVEITDLIPIAGLYSPNDGARDPDGFSYRVQELLLATYPAAPGAADIQTLFNEVPVCNAADVIITVA